MAALADFVGADDAGLGSAHQSAIPWLVAPRTDPQWMTSYAKYRSDDLFWQRLVGGGEGTVAIDGALVGAEELKRNRFHQEWSVPQGYRHKLGAFVGVDDGWMTVLVLPARRQFDRQAGDALASLLPHLRRALKIERMTARCGALDQLCETLIAAPHRGAVILDGAGAVLAASDSAARWFEEGFGRCERTIGRADDRTICLDSGRRLDLVPLIPPGARSWPGLPAALVVQALQSPAEEAQILCHRFGLTPAEAAMALELRLGGGRKAAAHRRGIRDTTARTHLSRIFDKLQVSRQAELVSALDRLLT